MSQHLGFCDNERNLVELLKFNWALFFAILET